MEQRIFACDNSTQQSSVRLHIIYLGRKEGGGGGSELESRADTFKKNPGMNWVTKIEHPLKISIQFSLKYSTQFVPGFSANQHPDPNEPKKRTKVKIRSFNSSIGIYQNDFAKINWQK